MIIIVIFLHQQELVKRMAILYINYQVYHKKG